MKSCVSKKRREKILSIGCLSVAVVLIVSSVSMSVSSSVIGSDVSGKHTSPLFAVRAPRSPQQLSDILVESSYLGIDSPFTLSFASSSYDEGMVAQVYELLNSRPSLLSGLYEKLYASKQYQSLLDRYGLSHQQVTVFGRLLSENPELFEEQLAVFETGTPLGSGLEPLGFETVIIECLITAIILAPIVVVVTLLALFFTLRILTCLNINDCANEIAQGILDSLSQGLHGAG